MMELYQAFADYTEMMAITEELITQAARRRDRHDGASTIGGRADRPGRSRGAGRG